MNGEEFISWIKEVGDGDTFTDHVNNMVDGHVVQDEKYRQFQALDIPVAVHVKYIVFSTDGEYFLFNLKFLINIRRKSARLIDAVAVTDIDTFITPDLVYYHSVYEQLKSFIYKIQSND